MKILILTNSDVGLYQFRRELISALSLAHHEITIALPNGSMIPSLEQMGCHFVPISLDRRGINPARDLSLFIQYLSLLRRESPDLVITYTIKPNIYGGIACRLTRIPYTANITGLGTAFQKKGLLRSLVSTMYRIALRRAKVIFFENKENESVFLEQRLICATQSVVLHGAGVNLTHFSPTAYPSSNTVTRFLFIGRLMREKGVDELFSSMERLWREGFSCCLDIVGDCEEDYTHKIQTYVQQGWLFYHGFQNDVRPFIAASHCFVLPSWHEGMANTNLECAAMCRPLITSRIHGCMEAVEEGKSGLLCEPQNAQSLYLAMRTFCKIPPQRREAMGLAGRAHMEKYFDKRQVVAATIKALGI